MEPVYIGVGIKEKDTTIIALCVNPDKETAEKLTEERKEETKCKDWKVFNIIDPIWVTEFQWWLVDYGITNLESKELAKEMLSLLLGAH